MAKKGIELPVNVMVIIAIAVIVLLGLVALFTFGIRSGVPLQVQLEKGTACTSLVNRGCVETAPSDVDVSIDVTDDGKVVKGEDTLQKLCDKYFGTSTDAVKCKRVCSCTGI
jgi:cytochrome c-type biogenesis protein CcmE